jgi:organic radical activating enzyme
MFGTNEIVGKKYFKEAPKDSLFVTSMFFTLQGEGPYAGKPALFVRLAKCNLACSFCDTFFDDGDWLTITQIESKIYETICNFWNNQGKAAPGWAINGFNSYPGVVLVMTGGEPLLQDNISSFMERQLKHFGNVQVESNGILDTVVPEGVTLVCSPKCSEKNGVAIKYLAPSKTILERADCLKFVMSADKESPYYEIPDWAHEWRKNNPNKEIYVSPMNIYNTYPQKIKMLRSEKQGNITLQERSTVDEVISFWEPGLLNLKENQENHEYTAKYCMEHGLRLNLQMHLYASLA